MVKLLGIFVIIGALVITGWLVIGTYPPNVGAIVVGLLALFIGVFMVLQDRIIEITVHGVGTIKTAAEQAFADAQAISDLKTRLEAQSATVDLVAKEARSTVEQLRNIATVNAEATLTDIMAGSFLGSTTLKTRLALHDRIVASLKDVDVSDEKIKEAKKMWNRGIGIIYHRGIRRALEEQTKNNQMNTKASFDVHQASQDFQKLAKFEQWEAPSPDEMTAFVEEREIMNDTVKELIADYRHFLKTGSIRRQDVFEQL